MKTIARKRSISITQKLKRKVKKYFYKVSSKPLFKQKLASFAVMLFGLSLVLIKLEGDCTAGILFIAAGLYMFCTKETLFD